MLDDNDRALLTRFAGSAPRYTSYPTAPYFTDKIGSDAYRSWLARLPEETNLSIYTHIPYCGTLCWFCACRSQGVRSAAPVLRYLDGLMREIETLGPLVAGRRARHLHWGGGSPTILTPEAILRLAAALRAAFNVASGAEFAVEIDPRDMTEARMDALAEAGVTRVSLGVQDFNREVQDAINRVQSVEETRAVVEGMRARGARGVNIDALYGLPHQSVERMRQTIDHVIALAPDRVALFGYAHVPWMAKRQKLIPQETLPNAETRFVQARAAADALVGAGYVRIGLDHFAKPGDALADAAAAGTLRRNFQGYTADGADALLGLGASAIGRTPFGYVQNIAGTAEYLDAAGRGALPIARGLALSLDDQMRAAAIERLMCRLDFDGAALAETFGDLAEPLKRVAAAALADTPAGLLEETPNGFRVTERGRPFLRSIAQRFDAYAEDGAARYSRAV